MMKEWQNWWFAMAKVVPTSSVMMGFNSGFAMHYWDCFTASWHLVAWAAIVGKE